MAQWVRVLTTKHEDLSSDTQRSIPVKPQTRLCKPATPMRRGDNSLAKTWQVLGSGRDPMF